MINAHVAQWQSTSLVRKRSVVQFYLWAPCPRSSTDRALRYGRRG